MDPLWITEPARTTCLATVTAVHGSAFAVDRALFAPQSRACRHPQPHDGGTVWWDGDKRRLRSVSARGATVWYALYGAAPPVGTRLRCLLDQEARLATSRAHTAMHLLLAALADGPPMVADPVVKGGGHVRFTFASPLTPEALQAAVAAAARAVAADRRIARSHAVKADALATITPQPFQPPDPVPGPDVVPLVRIGDVTYPCDGSHVDRTSRVGRIEVTHAAMGREGFVVTVRACGEPGAQR